MTGFYKKNISILSKKDSLLSASLNSLVVDIERYMAIKTKTDKFTVKVKKYNSEFNKAEEFFIHSKYDPEKNAEDFAQNNINTDGKDIMLYGFGLGYHIEKMIKYLQPEQQLYVIEFDLNILKMAFQLNDLAAILNDPRIHILTVHSGNISQIITKVINDGGSLILYAPSIKLIPEEYSHIRFLLEDISMKINISEDVKKLLQSNVEYNTGLNSGNIDRFIGKFKNMPIVIVSAGPSLDNNKHMLKEVQGKAIIFAAGRALKSLLNIGVNPDMFCIIDPQFELTYKQIQGYEDLEIPLLFLDTASSETISKYNGPKYMFTNQIIVGASKDGIVDTGGSVATAILDMSIKFGGNPIIFIGQDLAYTDKKNHAKDAVYNNIFNSESNTRKIKGQDGSVLDTTLYLLSFKNWIENKIKKHPDIRFINATEGGAFIEGCEHISMAEVVKMIKL